MHILVLLVLVPVLLAIIMVLTGRAGVVGWLLIITGTVLLAHGGISIYRIEANNGVVPSSVNAYLPFATIPAGTLLLIAGGLTFCIRKCVARRRLTKLEERK